GAAVLAGAGSYGRGEEACETWRAPLEREGIKCLAGPARAARAPRPPAPRRSRASSSGTGLVLHKEFLFDQPENCVLTYRSAIAGESGKKSEKNLPRLCRRSFFGRFVGAGRIILDRGQSPRQFFWRGRRGFRIDPVEAT